MKFKRKMKRISKRKSILLSLLLAVFLLTPIFSNAQKGGLFGYGTSSKEVESESLITGYRGATGVEWGNGGLVPQDPTQESPLGSGVLIIVAASAGYVLVKSKSRKEEQ
jgi:hypothetical protein